MNQKSVTPLVLAIDFDETFTADEILWADFIVNAISRGHRVYCVTARRDDEDNMEEITEVLERYEIDIPIVFCNMGSKMWTMEQRGVKVNIWIDDAPHALVHGH